MDWRPPNWRAWTHPFTIEEYFILHSELPSQVGLGSKWDRWEDEWGFHGDGVWYLWQCDQWGGHPSKPCECDVHLAQPPSSPLPALFQPSSSLQPSPSPQPCPSPSAAYQLPRNRQPPSNPRPRPASMMCLPNLSSHHDWEMIKGILRLIESWGFIQTGHCNTHCNRHPLC